MTDLQRSLFHDERFPLNPCLAYIGPPELVSRCICGGHCKDVPECPGRIDGACRFTTRGGMHHLYGRRDVWIILDPSRVVLHDQEHPGQTVPSGVDSR